MMRRVWRLLDNGVQPNQIFAVTFTRTAARDLLENLSELRVPGSDEVVASTLHSFCFRLLNSASVLHVLGRNPRILMEFEVRFMVEDLKIAGTRSVNECNTLLKAFAAAWARLQSDVPGWPISRDERVFQTEMTTWLQMHRSMLVSELTVEALKYLRNNNYAPERSQFSHVLVDEYQDLNKANQLLIDLVSEAGSLAIVGDEDQSIYSDLQFAQPEGIRDFAESHPGTENKPLSVCRRCPTHVVELANSLIQHNPNRENRLLEPFVENPVGEVHHLQWPTLEDEAIGMSKFIIEQVNHRGLQLKDVLVLTPRRRLGYRIRNELLAMGIEAHSYFAEQALESDEAQKQFVLLTLLSDPADLPAMRCWLGFGRSNLAKASYARVLSIAKAESKTICIVFDEIRNGRKFPGSGGLAERLAELDQLKVELSELRGTELIERLFPEGAPELTDLREISRLILENQIEPLENRDLLEELRSRVLFPEPPPNGNYVRIMSLHKSKGLSAELVVISGCVEGFVPFKKSGLDQAANSALIEEQRRLFYVAITRARSVLALSSFRSMDRSMARSMNVSITSTGGQLANVLTSRFIAELGRI